MRIFGCNRSSLHNSCSVIKGFRLGKGSWVLLVSAPRRLIVYPEPWISRTPQFAMFLVHSVRWSTEIPHFHCTRFEKLHVFRYWLWKLHVPPAFKNSMSFWAFNAFGSKNHRVFQCFQCINLQSPSFFRNPHAFQRFQCTIQKLHVSQCLHNVGLALLERCKNM